MIFKEYYDIEKLQKIITTPNILKLFENKINYSKTENTTYQKYLIKNLKVLLNNLDRTGMIDIPYKQNNGGRYFLDNLKNDIPVKIGLQNIMRPIRQYLTYEDYIDIDMINSQPSILYGLTIKYKIENTFLSELINDRDNIFKRLIKNYNIDKDTLKILFIRMLNLGGYKNWFVDYKIEKEPSPFIIGFYQEIKSISKKLLLHYPELKTEKNTDGSKIAIITQRIENDLLMELYNFLKINNHIKNEVCSLQFDGLQILKIDNIREVLNIFNSYIKSLKTEYEYITFKIKSLDIDITEKDFKKAQKELIKNNLFYFDYTILHNYLYGTYEKKTITINRKKIIKEYKKLSPLSINFIKLWFKENIILIDNNSNKYWVIRTNNFCDIENKKIEMWKETSTKELSIDIKIKSLLKNITSEEECDDEPLIIDYKTINIGDKINTYFGFYEKLYLELDWSIIIKSEEKFIPYFENIFKNETFFNKFNGFDYKKIKSNEEETETFVDSPFYNHIKNITCNEDMKSFEYVNKWIAQLIQKPEKKHRVSLCQFGPQGSGKDTFCNFITVLIGSRYVYKSSKLKEFLGDFNSLNSGKLLIIFNEVKEKSSKTNHDEIKDVVDKKTENINRKYMAPIVQSCFKRFIFNTNNRNAFNIEDTNSRYFMLDTSKKMARNIKYFNNLSELLTDKKYLKMAFDYYANLDISDFSPYVFPKTKYETEQKLKNLPSPTKFLLDIYEDEIYTDNIYPYPYTIKNYNEEEIKEETKEEKPEYIEYSKKDFYFHYVSYSKKNCYIPQNKDNFWKCLEGIINEEYRRGKTHCYKGKRKKYIIINEQIINDYKNTL